MWTKNTSGTFTDVLISSPLFCTSAASWGTGWGAVGLNLNPVGTAQSRHRSSRPRWLLLFIRVHSPLLREYGNALSVHEVHSIQPCGTRFEKATAIRVWVPSLQSLQSVSRSTSHYWRPLFCIYPGPFPYRHHPSWLPSCSGNHANCCGAEAEL